MDLEVSVGPTRPPAGLSSGEMEKCMAGFPWKTAAEASGTNHSQGLFQGRSWTPESPQGYSQHPDTCEPKLAKPWQGAAQDQFLGPAPATLSHSLSPSLPELTTPNPFL